MIEYSLKEGKIDLKRVEFKKKGINRNQLVLIV